MPMACNQGNGRRRFSSAIETTQSVCQFSCMRFLSTVYSAAFPCGLNRIVIVHKCVAMCVGCIDRRRMITFFIHISAFESLWCVCVCMCGTVYLSFSSYQLGTAGALLQYIAAAREAECIADTMGNINQYFLCL